MKNQTTRLALFVMRIRGHRAESVVWLNAFAAQLSHGARFAVATGRPDEGRV
ncbi:MAG: hypothetical protein AAF196_18160 [Planctomycetota bacterium]